MLPDCFQMSLISQADYKVSVYPCQRGLSIKYLIFLNLTHKDNLLFQMHIFFM